MNNPNRGQDRNLRPSLPTQIPPPIPPIDASATRSPYVRANSLGQQPPRPPQTNASLGFINQGSLDTRRSNQGVSSISSRLSLTDQSLNTGRGTNVPTPPPMPDQQGQAWEQYLGRPRENGRGSNQSVSSINTSDAAVRGTSIPTPPPLPPSPEQTNQQRSDKKVQSPNTGPGPNTSTPLSSRKSRKHRRSKKWWGSKRSPKPSPSSGSTSTVSTASSDQSLNASPGQVPSPSPNRGRSKQRSGKWWKGPGSKKGSKKGNRESRKKYKEYSPSYAHLRQTDTESDPEVENLKLIELTEEEEEFFGLVVSGNVQAVSERITAIDFDFDANVLNMEGNSVLHIAVSRQDEAMVEVLSPLPDLRLAVITDVLLYAIMERNVGLVRTIHSLVLTKAGIASQTPRPVSTTTTTGSKRSILLSPHNFIEIHKEFGNSKFHEHITPLLLAAQIGSYELIKYFHEQGDYILMPHPTFCTCVVCSVRGGELQRCYRRLHTYQALCNPYYLCYQATRNDKFDPILESFKLVKTLEQCLIEEPSFRSAYNEIIVNLKHFTCDLVEQCRSTEVELLLKQKQGYQDVCGFYEPELYPRASLAIQYEQKEFISHPFVQMVLYQQWAGDWPGWKVKAGPMKLFHTLIRIVFLVPLVVVLLLTNFGRSIRAPVNRCVNSMASYIVFLAFLFVISITKRTDSDMDDKGPPRTGLEWPIIIMEIGHIYAMMLQAFKTPRFFLSKWTYVEIFTHMCFVATFICWLIAYFTNDGTPRRGWKSECEPILVAEAFFGVAQILSYAKVLRILQLQSGLGPVITSLGQMVNDVMLLFTFFFIIICSFAMGLNYVYRHLGKSRGEETGFEMLGSSIATLFWSLYMLGGDPVHMEEIEVGKNKYYLSFTRGIGEVIYEAYYIIGTIFLLNLLLAAMANTYEGLTGSDSAVVHWNFVRASIWTSYSRDLVVPSPFNLIPISIPCFLRFCKHCGKKARDEENARDLETRFEYYNLVLDLVFRYFRDKAETSSVLPASTDDLQALNEDLAELRSAMKKDSRTLRLAKTPGGDSTGMKSTGPSQVKRRLIFTDDEDE